MPITSIAQSMVTPEGRASRIFQESDISPRILSPPAGEAEGGPPPAGGASFEDLVKGFIGDVNHLQVGAGRAVEALAAGDEVDLLLQLRNRVTDAFQEIMRMQV